MPISVTCQCGARLEIDEKFLGKDIPCPDCQRPLPTTPPATPPPLDLPDHRRKSGLAVLSLTLAFIPIVNIAAIPLGILALKQIAQKPGKYDGANYARAGIIVAGVGLFMTLVLMIFPFGIDQLLRELATAGYVDYSTLDGFFENPGKAAIKRPAVNPGQWSRWTKVTVTNNLESDDLLLVNTREDAYLSCFKAAEVNVDEADEKQKKVLERFYKSELVNLLGRLGNESLNREGTIVKAGAAAGDTWEVTLDLRLAGVERRFLIQYPAKAKHHVEIVVGAARRGRFEAMEKDFRDTFATVKFKL